MSRILITGGRVVTMQPGQPELARGDVLIADGRIAAIGAQLAPVADAETIDAAGMIVMPGLVNAHVHTWQSALRGIAADWTVAKYMAAMHRGLAMVFRPEDIFIANLMGALNQINSGTTTLVDWCHNNPTPEHTDAAIAGLDEAGIRAVFLHGSPKPSPKPGQRPFSEIPMPRSEVERLRKGRFASDGGLVTMGLAILGPYYSVYDVTREDARLARELDLIASMHVGGGVSMTPDGFARLDTEGLIGANFNVVHGNDLSDEELRMLVGRGANFTVTADIELQMGYGHPLTGKLKALGSPISVGSDVEPAVRGDMFGTMRLTLQHERNRRATELLGETGSRPPDIPITAREALEWTTVNAAKAFRLDRRVGSLAPGKQADIVLLRADDINMFPVHDAVASVVMQAGVANVDTVLVGGRVMKRSGKLMYGDLARRKDELRRSGERILAACGLLPEREAEAIPAE